MMPKTTAPISVPSARVLRWVPPYIEPEKPDLFYINNILSAMWRAPDGSLPRLGNPQDPLDDLIYLMLTRRGHIAAAQRVFESLHSLSLEQGHGKPDWSWLIDQGISKMALSLNPLGMGRTRAREIYAALSQIRSRFSELTLDPLRRWNNARCLEFLCSLPGVSLKTAACVMLYTLDRDIFPADVHCIRMLARLGLLPRKYERKEHHKEAQRLLLNGLIPKGKALSLHVSMVLHGQNVCTTANPKCHVCPVRGFCADFHRHASEQWQKNHAQPSCVDLFSGAGGTSIGFSRPIEQGHDPGATTTPTMRIALAVELDRWAHKTYAINHPEIPLNRLLRVDLTRHTTAKKIRMALSGEPNLVLIIGGPPCQKVSLIGTTGRRLATSKYGRFDRRRGAETYRAFRDVVRTLRTRFFILENVPGLFAAHDGTACHDIIEDFSDLYSTASIHVEAHDHGVPQRRRRILIAGVLKRGSPEIAHNALTFLLDRLLTPSCTLPGLQRLVKQFPTCHRSIHPAGQSSAGILCQLMLRRPLAGSVLPIN